MRRRWKIGVVLLAIWLIVLFLGRLAFHRHDRRLPGTWVRFLTPWTNMVYNGNDWLGLAPECKCFFRFNITSNDFARLVKRNGFAVLDHGKGYYWPGFGPLWFTPPVSNGQYFARYLPTDISRFPRWSQHEYLWLDQTGTNAFFLVWRMD